MKSPSLDTVSVVIPAYNAEKFLRDAIASVLQQSFAASEIIVVDDGSADGTAAIAQSFSEVVYVRQDNAGVASALNHGAAIAKSNLIAFLSADDIWEPNKLRAQYAALDAVRERLVFGHMQHFISPDVAPDEARKLVCPPDPMPAYSAGTMLTAIETLRSVGPFDEAFKVGEFMDWFGRARDLGLDVVMLEQVVSMRRVHEANHSAKTLRTTSYAPVLKALLDRRRAEAAKS